jgi:all-trans-retinol 13,14-reductase
MHPPIATVAIILCFHLLLQVHSFIPKTTSSFVSEQKRTILRPFASLTTTSSARARAVSTNAVTYRPSLKLQEEIFDTIVIGSGIGGLATASLLAQSSEKHKVLVLEQHYKIGGCCHTFTKKGYRFGTGIHYVGEVGDDCESSTGLRVRELLQAVAVKNDSIPWTAMPPNYDTIVLGKNKETSRRYEIWAFEQQQKLKEQFPDDSDHKAIDEYFDLCRKVKASFGRAVGFKRLPRRLVQALRWTGLIRLLDKGYHKYAKMTLHEVVHSLTDNPDLQAVLMYNWGDYGCAPKQTPFLMHSLLVAHYRDGGYYPQGGSDVICDKILPVITAHGGQVLTNAPVRRVIMDEGNKQAAGVELMDGTQIRAKRAVVSDAGVINTCQFLVPPEKRKAMMKRLAIQTRDEGAGDNNGASVRIQNGETGLCLFVGLQGDHDADLQLPHYHLWMYPSAAIENDMENLSRIPKEQLQKVKPHQLAPLYVGSPSGKDGSWKKECPGKSTLEIITSVPFAWFEEFFPDGTMDPGGKPGSHGIDYANRKEILANLLWTRARQGLVDSGASESLPQTLAEVAVYELGTPITYAHYLWNDKGAFYGLDHNVDRFSPRIFFQELRPEIPEVPGLYLSGQDITVSSLTGALCGAYLCASKILGVLNPFSLLKEVDHNRVESTGATKSSAPVLIQNATM